VKSTKALGLLVFGVLGAGVVAAILLVWWRSKPHEPSDLALERGFYRHRPELERLVAMMAEDSQMIAPSPPPESERGFSGDTILRPRNVSRARWDEYKELFSRADIKNAAVSGWKSNESALVVYSWGNFPSSESVGYLHCGQPDHGYAPAEPACIERKDSGVGMYGHSSSFGYRYKKIAKDWFILQQSQSN